jgi:hypothetical protein
VYFNDSTLAGAGIHVASQLVSDHHVMLRKTPQDASEGRAAMSHTENVVSPHQEIASTAYEESRTGMGTIEGWLSRASDSSIDLRACVPFERIIAKTRGSVYELVVLAGRIGEVLVRGGRFFPEFSGAILRGSTAGGSSLKRRSLGVGLRMEFLVGDRVVVTSPVSELSHGE